MTTSSVTRWTIEHSPALSLKILELDSTGLSKEEQHERVRQHLLLSSNPHFEIHRLSDGVATHRSRTCGEDFAEVYQASKKYYLRELDAIATPQMS